jgi:hypothetical protein
LAASERMAETDVDNFETEIYPRLST